jgi:hypothetical protein
VHSLRTVVGLIAIGVLRFTSLAFRLLGNFFGYVGVLVTQLYDLPLFIPLWWSGRKLNTNMSVEIDYSEVRS